MEYPVTGNADQLFLLHRGSLYNGIIYRQDNVICINQHKRVSDRPNILLVIVASGGQSCPFYSGLASYRLKPTYM